MAERVSAPMSRGSRCGPDESRKLRFTETQNSGNEAKKCLKTKKRSRNLHAKVHPLDAENEQITAHLAQTKPRLQRRNARLRQ
jgi:hypothetical protein